MKVLKNERVMCLLSFTSCLSWEIWIIFMFEENIEYVKQYLEKAYYTLLNFLYPGVILDYLKVLLNHLCTYPPSHYPVPTFYILYSDSCIWARGASLMFTRIWAFDFSPGETKSSLQQQKWFSKLYTLDWFKGSVVVFLWVRCFCCAIRWNCI